MVCSQALKSSVPVALAHWDNVWPISQQSLGSLHSILIGLRLEQMKGDLDSTFFFLCKHNDAASFFSCFKGDNLRARAFYRRRRGGGEGGKGARDKVHEQIKQKWQHFLALCSHTPIFPSLQPPLEQLGSALCSAGLSVSTERRAKREWSSSEGYFICATRACISTFPVF